MTTRGIPIVEENVTKGGHNPPNMSDARPPAPVGSGGAKPVELHRYCPACGEVEIVSVSNGELVSILPGIVRWTCPSCDTIFEIRTEYYPLD